MRVSASFESLSATVGGPLVTQCHFVGKTCLRFGDTPFLVQDGDRLAFRLRGTSLNHALALQGAAPWHPTGSASGGSSWVALRAEHRRHFAEFARTAMEQAGG